MSLPPLGPPGAATGLGKYGEWYTCKLGGTLLPGRWRVTSGLVGLKEDPKPKAGADGSNPVFHGLRPERFEIEGEQYSNDERDQLQVVCAQLLPQPGLSQNQFPLQLQHPSVLHFGFAINVVVLGGSILEHVGPCTSRMKLYLRHWLPSKSTVATVQPTRSVRNVRAQAAAAQNPQNPLPTAVPGIAGPPKNFTPGQ